MKYILFTLLLHVTLIAQNIAYGEERIEDEKVYTIQLFSTKAFSTAKKLYAHLPEDIKSETHLYKVGEYTAARYKEVSNYATIRPLLKHIKATGFNDAFVLKSSTKLMADSKLETQEPQNEATPPNNQADTSAQNLSKFTRSKTLLKAESAYQRGDETEAMLYYEMLLASGYSSAKVKNNLCYLYGKRGAFFRAQKIIESQRYQSKLLYAYAYGAVENNQKGFYEQFAPYIMQDRDGRLALLAGYYFEKNGQMPRAFEMYKMAYEKNPSDHYILYAYARAADIRDMTTLAKTLYTTLIAHLSKESPLKNATLKRLQELEGAQ